MNLTDVSVLILDCQATGSSPQNAELIEFGWARYRISDDGHPDRITPHAHLVKPREAVEIPRRVRELTGISSDMLTNGDSLDYIEESFLENAERTDRLIAHYAQYEQRFLKARTALRHPERFHNQQFLCTHEIATRLYPDLPRRSLRAMAGYFGHSLPDTRRVTPHIRGTATIWKNVVRVLKETEDIRTLRELETWLEQTSGQRTGTGFSYPISRERRLSLPDRPGTYHMIDEENRILYIGKATSLKDRVNSYFQSGKQLSNRKLELVSRVKDVECKPVPTPLEASLRENDEIKDHNPPYNESLTSDEREIRYSDVTFTRFDRKQNDTYPIGPFSRLRRIEAMGAILQLLRGESPSGSLQHLRPLKSLISQPAFMNGIDLVRKRHGLTDRRDEKIPQTLLLSIGKALWVKKRKDPGESDGSGNEQSRGSPELNSNRSDGKSEQSPEDIADRIESVLRRGARDVRRARWYEEIASSKLSWQPRSFNGDRWRTIVLKRGQIEHRTTTSSRPDLAPPVPSPSSNPIPSNVTVHDRLRVFTTALKQMVEHTRPAFLETGSGARFDRSDLKTVLWWV